MTTTLKKRAASLVLMLSLILLGSAPLITPVQAQASEVINAWWPVNGAHVSGTQPFKAAIPGTDVSQYDMFWQVDGGQLNPMSNNYTDYQHKEATVDVSSWNWHGSGPYLVNFVARRGGTVFANAAVTIYIENGLPQQTVQVQAAPVTQVALTPSTPSVPLLAPAPTPAPAPVVTTTAPIKIQAPAPLVAAPTVSVSVSSDPLSGVTFYVDPHSAAAQQAQAWQSSNPAGASKMNLLAAQPTAVWLGEWNSNVSQDVHTLVANAQAAGAVPTFVAYAIPERDCGGYSSGGTNNPSAYASWISQVASGIGAGRAVVILEPDSLAQITCLSSADQATRLSLIGMR